MSKMIRIIIAGIFCISNAGLLQAQATETPSANVLWIIAEDLSLDLHCYGNSLVKTPVLDALAEKGMRFTQAYATAPVCSPSRTALATGMYQTSIGAYHMRYPDHLKPKLPDEVKTIAQWVEEKGLVAANIIDGPAKAKLDWMFQFKAEEHFSAFHWAELSGQKKPFFAQLSLGLTHRPFEEVKEGQFDLSNIKIPPYYPNHEVSRQDFAGYYASIEKLDKEVGEVLENLKRHGLDENTIIFFFSDHGRPMSRAKNYHYDSGLKVPLIVYVPPAFQLKAYKASSVSHKLISLIDVSATSLHLLGLEKPSYMQGKVFLGNVEDNRDFVFSATNRIGDTDFRSRSVRTKQFRYSRHYHHNFSVNSSATAYRKQMHPIYHLLNIMNEKGALSLAQKALVEDMPYEELYDISNDPYETNNLIHNSSYKFVLADLRSLLDECIVETKDQGLGEDSKELQQHFEEYRKQGEINRAEAIEHLHQKVKMAVEK